MRLDSKAKLVVLGGIASASIFAFLGVREMSGSSAADISANAQTSPQQAPVQVLLAATTRPIKTGETITADMFRSAASDPVKYPGMATTAEVLGKVAAQDMGANALISRTALTPETRLAIRVPVGMRAISIDTTDEIAVAGLIRPGDRVDVQVVYPGEDALSGARRDGRSQASTLLQVVEVLAVGAVVLGEPANAGSLSSPPPPARTVTLALAPDQVSALSLAKNTGTLYLSLRNPEDMDFAETFQPEAPPAVTRVWVPRQRQSAAPKRTAAAPAKPAERPIELVVGGRKQSLYSGGATQ